MTATNFTLSVAEIQSHSAPARELDRTATIALRVTLLLPKQRFGRNKPQPSTPAHPPKDPSSPRHVAPPAGARYGVGCHRFHIYPHQPVFAGGRTNTTHSVAAGMKLTLGWPDGERREETDVVDFSVQWVGDEWLVRLTYRDGSDDVFTGKDIRVMSGKEVDAKTYAAKP